MVCRKLNKYTGGIRGGYGGGVGIPSLPNKNCARFGAHSFASKIFQKFFKFFGRGPSLFPQKNSKEKAPPLSQGMPISQKKFPEKNWDFNRYYYLLNKKTKTIMIKEYLHLFQTQQEHDAARTSDYEEPWVAYVESTEDVTYNKSWDEKYFTFEAIESGTFQFSNSGLSYSIDDGNTWIEIEKDTDTPTINAGNRIMFKGVLNFVEGKGGPMGVGTFSSSNSFNAMGNPYSLLYGDEFVGVRDLTGKNTALGLLFNNCPGLISAKNVALPATTLSNSCYYRMFAWCSSLTTTPELPATTLANGCYGNMFSYCSGLTTAPSLPAVTLASSCYEGMFEGCTSLATVPKLPARTLVDRCYFGMFYHCESLTAAPELPATTLANQCYYSMFDYCASLTTPPALPATTLANSCYSNMFESCTSLTTIPELPATTLAPSCYQSMFIGCSSLVNAGEILPATTLAENCYSGMFGDCISLTTPPALPATTLAEYCYINMFIRCSGLTSAPILSSTALTYKCYDHMFAGCTSLEVAPDLPATTLDANCYYAMFSGCTSLAVAPELPATVLETFCYGSMFYGCSHINYIKMLATDISATSCLSNWVKGVSSTGTFVKNSAAQWNVTGVNGIPTNWTVETASA